MNSKTLRLVLAFLAGFVLLSVAPRIGELLTPLADRGPGEHLEDLLLATAAGLVLVLLGLLACRHRRAPLRRGRGSVRHTDAPPVSPLTQRLRDAARGGERVPDLARRFALSQDAVRAAIGRQATTPAASTGKSFRTRQRSLPAKPRAAAVAAVRSPYRALA